jgi:hypothetical protein
MYLKGCMHIMKYMMTVYTYVHVLRRVNARVYAHLYVCTWRSIDVCTCVCVYVSDACDACIYVYARVCVFVRSVCVYICVLVF